MTATGYVLLFLLALNGLLMLAMLMGGGPPGRDARPQCDHPHGGHDEAGNESCGVCGAVTYRRKAPVTSDDKETPCPDP